MTRLGLQVLIGIGATLVGLYCVRKAFGQDINGTEHDAAFAGYLLGGFTLVGIGAFLVVMIGLAARLIL